jgi:hypothetical protein
VSEEITVTIIDTTCNDIIEIEKMAGDEIEGLYHIDYGGNAITPFQLIWSFSLSFEPI